MVGASIIFVDKLVRLFPGRKDFEIENSKGFLAASLSLSFGVMVRLLMVRGWRVLTDVIIVILGTK